MPNIKNLLRSFAAGEITPELFGRVDLDQFQTGLALCRNFITLPHGPAVNRAGTAFVLAAKNSATRSRLIPFTYSTTQTMALEFGVNYIRFHTNGQTLLTADGTAIYEVATPYAEADLFDLHYVQSADVMTIVHPNYAPMELRRIGASNWTLTTISFVSSVATPTTAPTAVATHGSTGTPVYVDYTYLYTALSSTGEESLASPTATCNNDLTLAGYTNAISWAAQAGATRYNVYRKFQGIYAFIAQTEDTSIVDNNISPDTGTTPPELTNPFSGAGNFPGAVSYEQQRRVFASTVKLPQNMWMTRTGTESNLSASTPSRDTDALTFRIAAREANTIRHIVPLSQLVLLTSSAEWAVTANGSATQALTPSTLSVQPQGYTGASNVVPVTVSNSLLYAMALGGHVGEMTYNYYAGGYVTQDISLMAPHLFDFFTIVDMAYSKAPYPIMWCVSSNGTLLGLTYSPANKVSAWHHHDTDGVFESVCVVTEGSESVLYVIVNRTIQGAQVRYVERMHSRKVEVLTDSFFVDAGVLYSGTATTTITGLNHLEGKTVSILADGAVQPRQTVTGGAVTLPVAASIVAVGLPITADLQTLPFSFQAQGYGQGMLKNVNKVWLRVHNSSGIFAGPSLDELVQYKQRTTEPYGSPPAMITGVIELDLSPGWDDDGSVYIRQSDPLPLIVASMTIEAAIGG
ncbi:hypothetical protein [Paraburkholderia sartisoli]|uniref:Ubiquitin-activating enzyme E1 FCCH domain-containing protein n=1 Tax=Paraburkholderia sartisoli TaxID=83784 RepID=A0A1H4HSJ1_9BURK|nr:hypothetical protein [Paraburkholderia sartisoli]SEB24797.1 hypothetical protein SAMN05192564_11541 [Paraburkholderia sartisoli]